MKYIAFVFALPLALVLFGAHSAHAAVVGAITVNQTVSGNTAITISTTTVTFITPGTYNITGIRWHASSCAAGSTLEAPVQYINGISHPQHDFAMGVNSGDNDLDLATPITVSGSSMTFYFRTDGTPDGNTWFSGGSCHIDTAYFLTDTPVPAMTIEDPANNSTTTSDFPYWDIYYNDDGASNITTSTPGKLFVYHGRSPTTLPILDERTVYSPNTISADALVTHSNLDGDGVWYARAYLYDYATSTYVGNLITSSPLITYTVGDITASPAERCRAAGEENDTSTSVVASLFRSVRRGVCEAGILLFSPDQERLEEWNTTKDTLASKPPFGYFAAISEGFNISTTSTSTQIMSATTTAALAPLFSPIRAGLGFMILVFAGFWLYHRFSLISLHG